MSAASGEGSPRLEFSELMKLTNGLFSQLELKVIIKIINTAITAAYFSVYHDTVSKWALSKCY